MHQDSKNSLDSPQKLGIRGTFSADRLSNGDNQRMEVMHSRQIRSRAAMRVDKEWRGTSSDRGRSEFFFKIVQNIEHIDYEK